MHEGVSQQGEAMITARGMEGGVVYSHSASIGMMRLNPQGQPQVQTGLPPGMSLEALTKKLEQPRDNKSLSSYLRNAGLSPLVISLLREVTPPEPLAHYSAADLAARVENPALCPHCHHGVGTRYFHGGHCAQCRESGFDAKRYQRACSLR